MENTIMYNALILEAKRLDHKIMSIETSADKKEGYTIAAAILREEAQALKDEENRVVLHADIRLRIDKYLKTYKGRKISLAHLREYALDGEVYYSTPLKKYLCYLGWVPMNGYMRFPDKRIGIQKYFVNIDETDTEKFRHKVEEYLDTYNGGLISIKHIKKYVPNGNEYSMREIREALKSFGWGSTGKNVRFKEPIGTQKAFAKY